MATFPQKPGAGAAAPAVPKGWREIWNLDCTAQDDHDLLTEGAYEDSTGVTTWDITDNTILGNANASVLEFQNGTGLVITTSANGEISVAQEVATLYPGVSDSDRLAFVVDFDSSSLSANAQYALLAYGTRDWSDNSFLPSMGYAGGYNYHGMYLRDDGPPTIGASLGAAVYDCIGLDVADQQARGYRKSAYAAPWVGWTAMRRGAWNASPATADESKPAHTDAWMQFVVNRNGSTNLTVTIRRMAMYGWVPQWAGD